MYIVVGVHMKLMCEYVCACYRELAQLQAEDPSFNLTLDDYKYFDENNISRTITKFMKSIDFNGITVCVGLPSFCYERNALNRIYPCW